MVDSVQPPRLDLAEHEIDEMMTPAWLASIGCCAEHRDMMQRALGEIKRRRWIDSNTCVGDDV